MALKCLGVGVFVHNVKSVVFKAEVLGRFRVYEVSYLDSEQGRAVLKVEHDDMHHVQECLLQNILHRRETHEDQNVLKGVPAKWLLVKKPLEKKGATFVEHF